MKKHYVFKDRMAIADGVPKQIQQQIKDEK